MKLNAITSACQILVFSGTLAFPAIGNAAANQPGTLATAPLFLQTAVEPNIFFLLDDSGSMEWENMIANTVNGLPNIGGWSANYYLFPSTNNGLDQDYIDSDGCIGIGCYPYVTPSEALVSGAWKVRNHEYNPLYYNPEVTYTPWPGTNAAGNPLYSNAPETAAPVDPANITLGTLNLVTTHSFHNFTVADGWIEDSLYPAQYYTWVDSDGDGVIEDSDAHPLIQITSTTASYTHLIDVVAGAANSDGEGRTDCSVASSGTVCTYAQEAQNFANWYSYYRKRRASAKASIGTVIDTVSTARMGLHLYNDGLIDEASSMNIASDKLDLLQKLYGLDIPCTSTDCPYTPARSSLEELGDYFIGNDSPILPEGSGGVCQQNYAVIIGDGLWNGPNPDAENEDGNDDSDFDSDSLGSKSGIKVGYGDDFEHTLADVAMYYYETDLKPGITDKDLSLASIEDPATHQHLVTYSVAFGQSGTLDPFDTNTPGVASDTDPADAGFSWVDPTDTQDSERIDDMWHAAFNGRGDFLEADNPQKLATSLIETFDKIKGRTSVAASISFDSTNLATGSEVFQAKFLSSGWGGMLISTDIVLSSNGIPSLDTTDNWNAHTLLTARNLSNSPRNVITYNGTKGIPFVTPADYTAPTTDEVSVSQINDLLGNAPNGDEVDFLGRIIGYLAGDRINEQNGAGTGEFRERISADEFGNQFDNILGDIVHSSPVYVGVPDARYPDDIAGAGNPLYTSYITLKSSRDPMVYVGANDGGLHAFQASTGVEHLMYYPSLVFSDASNQGLHYFSDPAYSHGYYVDMTPTVADIFDTSWKTVLVGGLRGGGKGVYVLDISTPMPLLPVSLATTANDMVVTEFTHNDLGYTFSKPQIGLMANGRWAAVFGNGYNSDPAGDGKAKLFVLYLDSVGGFELLDTNSGSVSNSDCANALSDCNGLATPTLVDTNGDGRVDRIYAGGLKGGLWAFNVASSTSASWSMTKVFSATDSIGTAQPITVKPSVARHPTHKAIATAPNLMVFFGTGQYISDADKTSTATQTVYGIWDTTLGSSGTPSLDRDDLVAQTISTSTYTSGNTTQTVRVLSTNTDNDPANPRPYGWHIDLTTPRERAVVDSVVLGELLFFNTLIPTSTTVCSPDSGGWLMAVDLATGGEPQNIAIDLSGDGQFTTADQINGNNVSGVSVTGLPTSPVFGKGPSGVTRWVMDSDNNLYIDSVQPQAPLENGRTSWSPIDLY